MKQINVSDQAHMAESVRVLKRAYFSTYHLYAARYAAEEAQTRETELAGEGNRFDIRHRGLVLSAIAESAFFLEAAINEVFQDAHDGHTISIDSLGEECLSAMAAVWKATDQGKRQVPALDKYDLALRLAGKEPFLTGAAPYQNAARLVQLRNHLVHYRPEYVSNDTTNSIGKMLKNLVVPNALMDESNPWFPDRALGAGCADWAWRSARALTDEFARRLGLQLNYQCADFGDPLPS
ncbi:hypothetical protein ACIG5D_31900 [Microbispora rosea]|uniref:hypothetical protein n=1 Tax=Microbispora rosea TaxID=58117 RepID=UPI0037C542E5